MDILKQLCAEFSTTEKHTQNVINLLDEGNTVPFIARYRKELTGNMDDQLIRSVSNRLNMLRAIEEKKEEIKSQMEKPYTPLIPEAKYQKVIYTQCHYRYMSLHLFYKD